MADRVGEIFRGIVTGASDKGVYVRVLDPPFEGRVVQGGSGLDVGCRVTVKLLHTDPERAFIDFADVSADCSQANGATASGARGRS
jgi:exoribonuclease-2